MIRLARKRTGKALLDTVNGSLDLQPDYPPDLDSRQQEIAGWLLDYLNDLGTYGWSDIELSQRLGFEQELSERLAELEQSGLAIYGGVSRFEARFTKGEPLPWRETVLLNARKEVP